jgi:hypothetical protein
LVVVPINQISQLLLFQVWSICYLWTYTTLSEHITFSSDRYINPTTTIENESLSPESFLDFVTNIPSSVTEELEFRTRGQAENTLWKAYLYGHFTSIKYDSPPVLTSPSGLAPKKPYVEQMKSPFSQLTHVKTIRFVVS